MWFSRRKEHKECKETEAPSLEGRLVLSSQCDSRLHTGVGLCSALHRFSALQENHPQLAVLDLQGLPGDCVSRCFALLLAFRTAARLLIIMQTHALLSQSSHASLTRLSAGQTQRRLL